jgi:2-dehydro-3-deoxygluconokinase
MKKIAVIGECMVEFFNEKDNLYRQAFAGDSANCAIYLKRNFKQSHIEYITVLGVDEFSNKMLDFFHDENLKTTYCDKLSDKNVGLYTISTIKGERSFSFWREDSSAKKLFTTKSLNKLKNILPKYDLIYLSAIVLAIMGKKGRKNLFGILKKAKKYGVKIAFDSNYRPQLYPNIKKAKKLHKKALKISDIFLPSIDDEKALFENSTINSVIKKAKKLGCSEIIVKCGKDSVNYFYKNSIQKVKIKPIKNIVDSTSAGDSFNGAYLASRLKGYNIKKSIKKANKVASVVIMHKGAIIPKGKNG